MMVKGVIQTILMMKIVITPTMITVGTKDQEMTILIQILGMCKTTAWSKTEINT